MSNDKTSVDCIENKVVADEIQCIFGFEVFDLV